MITHSKNSTQFTICLSKLTFSRISFLINSIIQIRNIRTSFYFILGTANIRSPSMFNSLPLSFSQTQLGLFYSHCFCFFQELFISLFKWRHNSHIIKFTTEKYTIQWFLVYSQGCTQVSLLSNSRIFSSLRKKENILNSSHSSLPPPSNSWQQWSTGVAKKSI